MPQGQARIILEAAGNVLVTSRAVLLDIGNASSTSRYLQVAVHFWTPLGGPQGGGCAAFRKTLHPGREALPRARHKRNQ